MDEELRSYLDAMLAEIVSRQGMVLDKLWVLERDFQNTREFLLGDALVGGRRWLDLEERVGRLEKKGGP